VNAKDHSESMYGSSPYRTKRRSFTTIKSPLYVHELEKAMNLNHNYADKLQFVEATPIT
jgi:hypothetical protein